MTEITAATGGADETAIPEAVVELANAVKQLASATAEMARILGHGNQFPLNGVRNNAQRAVATAQGVINRAKTEATNSDQDAPS